jgi:hypothetical protein
MAGESAKERKRETTGMGVGKITPLDSVDCVEPWEIAIGLP